MRWCSPRWRDELGHWPSSQGCPAACIERLMEKAEAAGDLQLVAKLLEQAARECGDAYSNRNRIAVKTTDNPAEAARRQELLPSISASMDLLRQREQRVEADARRS